MKKSAARESERTPVGKLNKTSFQFSRIWYTLWLASFDRFCQHSRVTDLDERYAIWRRSERPFNEWRGVQIYDKRHAWRFSYVECLREEQKDCMRNMVNGKGVPAILPTGFGKSLIFQLFPRVMSSINVIDVAVSTSMVIQLSIALVAIMNDQVEQLNKIRAAATKIGIDEEAAKNRNFKIVCQMGLTDLRDSCGSWHLVFFICRHLPFCFRYLDLSFRRVWHLCDLTLLV